MDNFDDLGEGNYRVYQDYYELKIGINELIRREIKNGEKVCSYLVLRFYASDDRVGFRDTEDLIARYRSAFLFKVLPVTGTYGQATYTVSPVSRKAMTLKRLYKELKSVDCFYDGIFDLNTVSDDTARHHIEVETFPRSNYNYGMFGYYDNVIYDNPYQSGYLTIRSMIDGRKISRFKDILVLHVSQVAGDVIDFNSLLDKHHGEYKELEDEGIEQEQLHDLYFIDFNDIRRVGTMELRQLIDAAFNYTKGKMWFYSFPQFVGAERVYSPVIIKKAVGEWMRRKHPENVEVSDVDFIPGPTDIEVADVGVREDLRIVMRKLLRY